MNAATAHPAPGSVAAWRLAIRVPTLVAGLVPVMAGTAVAVWAGGARWGLAALALVVSLGVQIGTNLVNDWADFRRGADTERRAGPVRVVQAGLLSGRAVLAGAAVAFGAAAAAGVVIAARAGWAWLALGAACLVCGAGYTAGPLPLAYVGLGEVFAFAFFGVAATAATAAVQLGWLPAIAWWLGAAVGCFAAALLAVNNLRDLATDTAAGKRTLAVRLGRTATQVEIACLLAAPFLIVTGLVLAGSMPVAALAVLAAAPLAWAAFGPVRRDTGQAPRALVPALVRTVRAELAFGVLLVVALVL